MNEAIPEHLRDHLALALIPELGPRRTLALLNHFRDPAAALQATEQELTQIELIGANLAQRFVKRFREVDVDAEWRLMQRHGVTAVPLGHPDYPEPLTTINNPPPLLYFRSPLLEQDRNGIAIVGSRSCTSYGRRMTQQIVRELVRQEWTIFSGLARGIDGIAHEAALEAGGRTVAVLAGGLSGIYPPEHADLAERVAAQGALLSETPMTMKPQAGMFPARNRIVSALSRAVVIVEANAKSGALITASHAAEQGREVFVLPGNVDSPASAGCLELIRKGARLVRNAADILEDLQGLSTEPTIRGRPTRRPSIQADLFSEPKAASVPPIPTRPNLSDQEARIWDLLEEPRSADQLGREAGLAASELMVLLTKLQMRKVIVQLPGQKFERNR